MSFCLPIEPAAGDLGRAAAFDDLVEGAGGLALEPGFLAGPQQHRAVVEGRKHRCPGRRVDKAQGDALIGVAGLVAQPVERSAHIDAAVVEHRRGARAETASVRDKLRHQPALARKAAASSRRRAVTAWARALPSVSPGNSSSSQTQSRNSISGKSRTSIHTTGSAPSLPWSCQVPFGVRIRSPRAALQRSPSIVV